MKLKNILLFITLLIFTTTVFANTNPTVTNVAFTIDGTTVTVTYDIADAEEDVFTVYMEVSEDGGTTWNFDYGTTSGAIGENVAEGTGKTITWQYSNGNAGTMKIKVLADDIFGDQIYYARKIYNTVTIGTQTWLKENLDIGVMINGSNNQVNGNGIEKHCYNDDPTNCDTYGGLYQWSEAMQYVTTGGVQGICPSNWHIPTKTEYETLETYVSDQATKLIDENARNGYSYTNETGFSVLFAGRRDTDGFFRNTLLRYAFLWTSSGSASGANIIRLYYSGSTVTSTRNNGTYSYSVRCIKN